MAETTTDASGHFEFRNLAPGPDYLVYFIPPQGWKIKFDNPTSPDVRGGPNPSRLLIEVEPGNGTLPTVPSCTPTATTTPPATPEPQGRSSSGLASTGASVIGLSALGALALLLGAGTMVAARRGRKT